MISLCTVWQLKLLLNLKISALFSGFLWVGCGFVFLVFGFWFVQVCFCPRFFFRWLWSKSFGGFSLFVCESCTSISLYQYIYLSKKKNTFKTEEFRPKIEYFHQHPKFCT